ncbi:MAG: hypothetical protein H7Z10_07960, partial [Gemmatimonadaceae bacterium]|nr:hypothetical protein [Acetobacteraceae bacterium]
MGDALQGRVALEAHMRPAAAVLSLGLLWPGLVSPGAAAQGILTAVRGERWAEAESLARAHPDPVAHKLVQYLRLLTAGAGLAPELSVFIAQNADWPQQALLARRLQEALAASGRDQSPASCQNRPALPAAQLLRCADAASQAGRVADAVLDARAGWIKGVEPAAEASFLLVWGRILTPDDHWRRFERLAWTDTGQPGSPAAQQARRL